MTMDTVLVRTAGRPGRRPTPQPFESPFGPDEIFFSTTDRRGIIRSGNRVFTRVSKYDRAELIGSPHSTIRHPDMPRVVFKLLWQEIGAGRPIAAYVKNMAQDGSYYWVLATIVPCEGGYLSVRIKPATPFLGIVETVYQDLLAVEQETERGEARRREEALAASAARLQEHLQAAGFADYGAFMRAFLLAEVKQRDAQRGAASAGGQPDTTPAEERPLPRMLDACGELGGFLRALVGRLDAYTSLSEHLAEKVQFASELAEDVQLFSMNALLAASHLRDDAAALGAVSSLMQARSDEAAPVFLALTDDVVGAANLLNAILVPVAIARLQVEAASAFVQELLEGKADERATADDLGALIHCLADEVSGIGQALTDLDRQLRTLVDHVDQLRGALATMRALELNGRIEAARVEGADGVVTLFRTIAETIARARDELEELGRAGRYSFAWEVRETERTRGHVGQIRELVVSLGAQR